jgi:hypothetical protein
VCVSFLSDVAAGIEDNPLWYVPPPENDKKSDPSSSSSSSSSSSNATKALVKVSTEDDDATEPINYVVDALTEEGETDGPPPIPSRYEYREYIAQNPPTKVFLSFSCFRHSNLLPLSSGPEETQIL